MINEQALEEAIEQALDGKDIFTEEYLKCGDSEKTYVDISFLAFLVAQKYPIIKKQKKQNIMKKIKEEIRKDVVNYLTKTSNHRFIKPKTSFTDKYEYVYDASALFHIEKKGKDFYQVEGGKSRKIDIEYYINEYMNNAKCVIKHTLFLGEGMKSIKRTFATKIEKGLKELA